MSDTPDRPKPLDPPDPSDPSDLLQSTDVAHPFDPSSVFDDLREEPRPAAVDQGQPSLAKSDNLDVFADLTQHDEHPLAPELFEHHEHSREHHDAPHAPADHGDGPDLLHSDAPIDASLFEDDPMDPHEEPMPAELFEDAPRSSTSAPAPVALPAAAGPGRPTPPPPPVPTRFADPAPRKVPGLAPAVGLLGLGELAIGAGLVYLLFLAPASAPPASPPADTRTAEEPKPSPDLLASLGKKIDALAADLKAQSVRVDEIRSGPAPAVDLKPIETRLNDLAKQVQGATPADNKAVEEGLARLTTAQAEATKGLDDLRKRVDDQSKQMADEKGRISAIVENLAKAPEARPAAGATARPVPGPATNRNEAEPGAYNDAVGLYRQNDFAGARAAFARLQQSAPNDARVSYFAALANGFATGQWTGETETLVNKGIEQEKAGTPARDKVEAAFADLGPPSAKAWLDAYRAKAR